MSTQIPSLDELLAPSKPVKVPPPPAAPARGSGGSVVSGLPTIEDLLRGAGGPTDRPTIASLGLPTGVGERIYKSNPAAIVDAIGKAEGVPSFGVTSFLRERGGRYATHKEVPAGVGRQKAASLVHKFYKRWVSAGKPGDFLDFLRDKYAPIGASNDPTNLNVNWLPNVVRGLPGPVLMAARDQAAVPGPTVGPKASVEAKQAELVRRYRRIDRQFEVGFGEWYQNLAKTYGLNPNPDHPLHFYDYRAAYRAGADPDETGHLPSQFKGLGHPNLIIDGIDTRTGKPADRALYEHNARSRNLVLERLAEDVGRLLRSGRVHTPEVAWDMVLSQPPSEQERRRRVKVERFERSALGEVLRAPIVGFVKGYLAPLPVQETVPLQTRAGKIIETGGQFAGFAFSPAMRVISSAIGKVAASTVGQRVGRAVAARVGERAAQVMGHVTRIAGDATAFAVLSFLTAHPREMVELIKGDEKVAAEVLNEIVGTTIEFEAWSGLFLLVRKGYITVRELQAISREVQAIRSARPDLPEIGAEKIDVVGRARAVARAEDIMARRTRGRIMTTQETREAEARATGEETARREAILRSPLRREAGGVILEPQRLRPPQQVIVPGQEAPPVEQPKIIVPRAIVPRAAVKEKPLGPLFPEQPQVAGGRLPREAPAPATTPKVEKVAPPKPPAVKKAAAPKPARPEVPPIGRPAVPTGAAAGGPLPEQPARARVGDLVEITKGGAKGRVFQVEQVGPRGYSIITPREGPFAGGKFERRSVLEADVRRIEQTELVQTAPTAERALTLEGGEIEGRRIRTAGQQQALEASARLQEQFEADATARKAAERTAKVKKPKPETELTIAQYIRSQGGISIEASAKGTGAFSGELRDVMRDAPSGTIKAKAGRSAQDMAVMLNEAGFRTREGKELDPAELPRILTEEAQGKPLHHPGAVEALERRAGGVIERGYAKEEARLSARVDEFLEMHPIEQRATRRAIKDALRQYGKPIRTERDRKAVSALSHKLYTQLIAGKSAEKKTPLFFHEYMEATEVFKRKAFDSRVPLDKRLDTATEHAEEIADRITEAPSPEATRRQNILDKLKDESGFILMDKAEQVLEPTMQSLGLAKRFYRAAIAEADGVVKGIGEPSARRKPFVARIRGTGAQIIATVTGKGREGTELVARKEAVDRQSTLQAGDISGRLARFNLTPEALDRIRSVREGEPGIALTEAERRALGFIEDYLGRGVRGEREARGAQTLLTPEATIGPEPGTVIARAREAGLPAGFLENYWPIVPNFEVLERRGSEAIREIMARTGADIERATEILNRYLSRRYSGRPFGNLERAREEWLPHSLRLSAAEELTYYISRAERRIAEATYFGPRDEVFNESLARIRERAPEDAAFVTAWYDAVTRRVPREAFLEGIVSEMTGLQTASKMIFSVVSNASQTANNLLVTNLTNFARSWSQIKRGMTHEEATDFGRRTGAAIDTVMRELRGEIGAEGTGFFSRLGRKVIERTGFMRVEEGNRVFTAVQGRNWARDLTQALVATEVRRPSWLRAHRMEAIRRHLEKVGIDPDVVAERGRAGQQLLTDVEERLAGLRLSELTQFPVNPGALPLWWSSPWGRVTTQFKRFAYKQGQFITKTIWEEASHGNFKPLIIFLTVFPLIGEVVADIRLFLRRFPESVVRPGEVLAEIPRDWKRRYARNMAYVGSLGVGSDFVRALQARSPRDAVASFLAGPTVTEAFTAGAAAGRTVFGPRRLTGVKQTSRLFVGSFLTPGLTQAFGIPGAILGEALESAGILRTAPDEGRGRGRDRRGR